jgi:hypothetical protein
MSDKWFFAGLISLLLIIWVVIGGPTGSANPQTDASGPRFSFFNFGGGNNNNENEEKTPREVKDELDQIEDELNIIEGAINASIYSEIVSLKKGNASREDVDDEYIIIDVSGSAKSSIPITGWILESPMTGKRIRIGNGVRNFISGSVNTEFPIVLEAGQKMIVASGHSPIGVSFRTNVCTGYLEQFQDFTPRLPIACPLLEDHPDIIIGPHGFNDACLDYIEDISRCEIVTDAPQGGLGNLCYPFISENNSYNGCVNDHKSDYDYFGDEWRIYLKQGDEIWKSKREVIKLFDQTGKLVDAITY